jgi:hypothetical protein
MGSTAPETESVSLEEEDATARQFGRCESSTRMGLCRRRPSPDEISGSRCHYTTSTTVIHTFHHNFSRPVFTKQESHERNTGVARGRGEGH